MNSPCPPEPTNRTANRSALFAWVLALTLLANPLPAAAGISNVRIKQRAGTNWVDIYYDLSTAASQPLLVAVAVSTNGGNSSDLPATHFAGDVGSGVTAGTNKLIVWDAVRDWPDRFSTNVFFRLSASDAPAGMALIPAGPFTMGDTLDGDANALPLHTNQISAFYMDQYEVTKELWDEVRGWANTNGYDLGTIGSGKAANHPVHTVNWYDVVKWCNARSEKEGRVPAYYTSSAQTTVYRTGQVNMQNDWVKWSSGYRLPTEAEWEKAARGGASGQRFPWGNTITHSNANYYSSSSYAYDVSPTRGYHPNFQAGGEPYTSPVGYFAPNGYGLYDMAGNVWEWTWDWWLGSYPSGAQADPRGPTSGSNRVNRGTSSGGNASLCRVAFRNQDNPSGSSVNVGFRSVLPPDAPAGMAFIPAGPFTMGDTLDGDASALPLHTNQISAFYMDRTEVTKALWDQVRVWANTNGYDLGTVGSGKATNQPVHTVNWYDVVKWCNARSEQEGRVPAYYTSAAQTTVYRTGQVDVQNDWVKWSSGYRLPTEAEWEKAARGGASGQRFPWGNTITHSNANYYSDSSYAYDTSPTRGYHPNFQGGGEPYTSPVGYFAPNSYGLYDMAGNVWEYAWDWSGSYSASPATDPRGPTSGTIRLHRGGSWRHIAPSSRASRRDGDYPTYRHYSLGFRSVLTAHAVEYVAFFGPVTVDTRLPDPAVPPAITAQPQSQTNLIGTAATFSVSATGTAPLAYQWRFNGTNLAGATGTDLTLTNAQTTNAGNYTVVVTNSYGSVTSAVAVLNMLSPVPAPAGLVSWWRADNSFLDAVGTNHGTGVNGVGFAPGMAGQAFSLDGADDYISLGSGLALGSMTLETWVYVQPANNTGTRRVISKDNAPFPYGACSMRKLYYLLSSAESLGASGRPGFGVGAGPCLSMTSDNVASPEALTAGWHHLAGVRDLTAQQMCLYVDGRLVAAKTNLSVQTVIDSDAIPVIGRTSPTYPTEHFQGLVDEASIYDRALASNEIAAIYLAGSAGKVPPATNLLANGSAETGLLQPWAGSGVTVISAAYGVTPVQGSKMFTFVQASGGWLAQTGSVPPGAGSLVLSGAYASERLTTPTGDDCGEFILRIFDANNSVIASNSTGKVVSSLNIKWESFELSQALPSGAHHWQVEVVGTLRYGGAVDFYCDDLRLLATAGQPTGPSITSQPQSQTNHAGTTASFSVTTTGTAPLAYQWRLNGTSLAGATGTSLTLANVQTTNAGNYTVLVTNSYGSVTSQVATLTVIPAGAIYAEYFSSETAGTAETLAAYPAFSFSGSGNAYVSNGVLFLQTGSSILSMSGYAGDLLIEVDMGAPIGGGGACGFKVNLVVGDNLIGFHPSCGQGEFRVDGPYGFYNDSMGFTPAIGVLHHLTVRITAATGLFEITVRDGNNAANVYSRSFTNPGYIPGCAIGFGGQHSNGATLIYDNLIVSRLGATNAPLITSQPESQSVVVGTNVIFGATASGTVPLAYQWRFNGVNVAGATNAALTITNVQPAAVGNYSVVVTNAYGSVTSALAWLTVVVPPSITAQPQSQTNFAGSTVSLTVTAAGTAPLAYQWQRGMVFIGGATNSSYTLNNVQLADSGSQFSVVVTNAYGAITSQVAVLTVTNSLGGFTPPSGCIAWWRGEGNVLDSIGNHHGAPTNQPDYGLGRLGQAFSFSGSNQIVIPNVTDLSFGSNGFSFALWVKQQSPTQYCNFLAKYNTSRVPYNREYIFGADAGGSVALSCIQNGNGYTSLDNRTTETSELLLNDTNWHHVAVTFDPVAGLDGVTIYFDGRARAATNRFTGSYAAMQTTPEPVRIGNLLASNGNNYSAGMYDEIMVFNRPLSSAEVLAAWASAATVPVILAQPQSQTNLVGNPVTLPVTVAGAAPLSYQWRVNGTNLSNGGRISGATSTNLSIADVQLSNAGNYTVFVTNNYGSVTSAVAVLTVLPVNYAPAIVQEPPDRTIVLGAPISLSVTATGTAPLSYQWFKSTAALGNGGRISGATSSNLVITASQTNDAGGYSVVVTNSVGSVTSRVALVTILVPPSIVQAPQSQTVLDGQSVTFTVQASGSPPLACQWRKNGTNVAGATSSTHTIFSVDFPDAGSYDAVVSNAAGSVTSTPPAVLTVNVAPRPDLVVTAANGPVEAWSDYPFDVAWTLANTGSASALGHWTDRVYLSSDSVLGGDLLLGSFPYSDGLAAGQSVLRVQSVSFGRSGITNGNYWIIVVTDADNAVVEKAGEGNNVRVSAQPVNVHLTPLPNLVVESITAPTNVFSGQKIIVQWAVRNRGPGAPDTIAWNDKVVLSVDGTPSSDDYWQTAVGNTAYVGSNEVYVASAEVEVPLNAFGNYQILVKTDSGSVVLEGNEDDNGTNRLISVTLSPAPDLQVKAVNAPVAAWSGAPMQVSWTVRNAGSGPVDPRQSQWTDSVFLSADTNLDVGDPMVAVIPHTGVLQAGEEYRVTNALVWTGPHWGSLYVFVFTDRQTNVWEHVYENNNAGYDPEPVLIGFTPPPDLNVCGVMAVYHTQTRECIAAAGQSGGCNPIVGTTITTEWVICNQGAGEATTNCWSDSVYLSPNGVLGPDSILIGKVPRCGGLAAGGSYQVSNTFQVPSNLSGSYRVIVVTDSDHQVSEYDPNYDAASNNTGVLELPIELPRQGRPDLQVLNVASLASGIAGQPTRVWWTVTNAGDFATVPAAWTNQIGLAQTDGSSQRALASVSVSRTLLPGETLTLTNEVLLSEDLSGDYRFYVFADLNNQVDEGAMETNNGAWASSLIHVDSYPPDLRVTGITAPTNAESGHPITVSWAVINQGLSNLTTRSWQDSVYLSRFPDSLSGAISLASASQTRSLALGSSYTNSVSAILPYRLSGWFYLHVQLDSGNAVFEGAGETNNLASSAAIPAGGLVINVTQTPMPDLVVTSVLPPSGGYAGRDVTVTWTVRNSGMAHTAQSNWVDTIYLSKDQVFDNTDPQVAYLPHSGGLLTNQSYTANATVTVPRNFVGPCYVFVRTDKNDNVFELNEDNNRGASAVAAFYTLAPPADLTITSITVPPAGISGQPVTVDWTVKNQGIFPAEGSWQDTVYLSADELWDIDDALLGRVTHSGPLAIGDSYSQTITNSLPGLTPGGYRVIVRTDIMNNVRESDESNNAGISAGVLTNDVIELTLGQPYTNVLATGDNHFYKVQVPAGETLAIIADSQATNAWNELFTRFDAMPSRADYDFLYERPFMPDVGLTVPETTNGWYYNLFRTEYSQTNQQNYQIEADLIPFSITSVYPTNIGDNGTVTLTIKGAKFSRWMTAKLVSVNGAEFTATILTLQNGTSGKAKFILTGVPHGPYRVRLCASDGAVTEWDSHVMVETTKPHLASLEVIGNTRPRFGDSAHFDGQIRNEGNVDIPYTMLFMACDTVASLRVRGIDDPVLRARGGNISEWQRRSICLSNQTLAACLVRNLEAGDVQTFAVEVVNYRATDSRLGGFVDAMGKTEFTSMLSELADDCALQVAVNPDLARAIGLGPFVGNPALCRSQAAGYFVKLGIIDAVEDLTRTSITDKGLGEGIEECRMALRRTALGVILTVGGTLLTADIAVFGLAEWVSLLVFDILTFDTHPSRSWNETWKLLGDGWEIMQSAFSGAVVNAVSSVKNCVIDPIRCVGAGVVSLVPYAAGARRDFLACITTVRASDPNDILGPYGFGLAHMVTPFEPLNYTIYFENVPTATAPAQTVRVRNQLPSTLDWRTFRLNEIVFGTNIITVPANRSYYQTRVNLGPDQNNLLADVIAGIDIRTGQAFCTLSAIDPATGEAPEDPQLGLLPPNNTNHVGEGHITYTIKPKAGQPTGTLITNQAAITFDIYETILTGIWTNTLDAFAPTSRVVSLPAQMNQLTFDVSWFGQDETNGSGVASYDVFLSDNGGDWTLWQSATTTNTAAFTGVPGHNYAFYSVARDNVGNVETKTAQAEAATTLAGGLNSPPVLEPILDQTVTDGQEVALPLIATDRDGTNQTLTLSFGAPAPTNALISQAEHSFRWTPTAAQAPSTNVIVITVADNATPPASDTKSFTVYVQKTIRAPLAQSIPGNQRVMVGGQATFAASFLGLDPLRYQWRFNGLDLANQTNATLVLSNVQPSQAGEYRLTVTNSYGSVTLSNILLAVDGSTNRPVIVQSPPSRSVLEGSNTTFTVVATGDAPLRYQWQRNGANLSSATNSSLSLTNVTALQGGSYRASVSNSAGAVVSAPALLTVLQAPLITVQPESLVVTQGHAVSLSVVAGGTTPLHYQWWQNSSRVTNGMNATLTWNAIPASAAGNYFVVVSNAVSSVTSAVVSVTVLVPPSVTVPPQSQTNLVGTTATLAVSAGGTTPLGYQWRKNGANLSNAGNVSGASSGTLTLSSVQTNDAGSYSVLITNIAGTVLSAPAWLTVWVPPSFSRQPVGQTVMAGGPVSFSASASGLPAPSYQWRWNGLAIGGANGSNYFIPNVQTNHAGHYSVVASSPAGMVASSDAALLVQYLRDHLFSSTNAIRIRDATTALPYPATITVSNLDGTVTKATATLTRLSHTWVGDVDALLAGPQGQKTLLMSDAGEFSVVEETFTFDDSAADFLPEYDWLFSGTYKPTDYAGYAPANDVFAAPAPPGPYVASLAVFSNMPPNGTWSLFVRDDDGKDSGNIAGGWRLALRVLHTAAGTPASPVFLLAPSLSAQGRLQFTLQGPAGQVLEVQASPDLTTWSPIATITNMTGTAMFADPVPLGNSRFYRVRAQ